MRSSLRARARLATSAAAACAALVLLACAPLRVGVSNAGVLVSALRLPVTIRTPEVNRSLRASDREALALAGVRVFEGVDRAEAVRLAGYDGDEPTGPAGYRLRERFDTLTDLVDERTTVVVAISGGGSRAAVLAMQTLALLERAYNDVRSRQPDPSRFPDLIDAVDAYSTVSGGSIFAYHVALNHLAKDREGTLSWLARRAVSRDDRARDERFQQMAVEPATRRGTRDVGFWTSLGYLSPSSLFLGPIVTLTTDRSYLDFLAAGLGLSRSVSRFFLPWTIRLGALEPRPLFLFNATSLETGSPFVITQSMLHLPDEPTRQATVRLDAAREPCCDRPLSRAATLEEINSSPSRFPLAYAAVSSAAYPLGLEPVPLRRYGWRAAERRVFATGEVVSLTDGGVYDNSGLSTAVDLFEYLVARDRAARAAEPGRSLPPRRLVLLAINAETWHWDSDAIRVPSVPGTRSWVQVAPPLRGVGVNALRLIYFTDQRRVEELAYDRLAELARSGEAEVLYFPVHLLQLSETDRFHLRGGPELFRRLQEVGTSYTITPDDAEIVAEAAERLVTADQIQNEADRETLGWPAGPAGARIGRLDRAFAYSVLRGALGPAADAELR